MKILLPIDFSRSSQDAVRFVASRETLLGSNPQIEILNVHAPVKRKPSFLFGEAFLTRPPDSGKRGLQGFGNHAGRGSRSDYCGRG